MIVAQTHTRPRVLVTSAAGRTAAPAVLDLLKKGFPVRAFVRRDDARAEVLRNAGAEIVALVHESCVRFRGSRPDWIDEVESPSHVQDEVPRPELGLLRSRPGPSRRHHHLVVLSGHRRLET